MAKKIIEDTLTLRKTNILFALIKEYCDYGEVVGSKEIQEKYNFGFSPATIRNEISILRDMGYLIQPFTNATSKPTEKAFKMFVNQLMMGLQITTKQQKDLEKQLSEIQKKHVKLSKEIARLLAQSTGGLGFAVNSLDEAFEGTKSLIGSDFNNELSKDSSKDLKVSQILDFLDNLDSNKQFLLDSKQKNGQLQAYFSEDNPVVPLGKGYAMVASEIVLEDGERTVIGLITPIHMLANKKSLEAVKAINKLFNKKY